MSDTTDPAGDPNETEGMRALRERLAREEEKSAAGLAAQRELAFLKAGIETDAGKNPQQAFFAQSYQGELTADAIKAKAAEFGFISATPEVPETPEPGDVNDPAQTSARQRLTAETADPAVPPTPGDPMKAAYGMYHEDKAGGATAAEASGAVLGKILSEARAGNKDFIFDADEWQSSEAAKSR